jgi:mono/diheme cytochrome c family protein
MTRPSLLVSIAVFGLVLAQPVGGASAEFRPGLALTFTAARPGTSQADTLVAPNVWLHVARGETPSPFLAPGPFTATWRGFLSVDLRSIHTFQAEVNGSLEVVINARQALEVAGDGGMSDAGPPMPLNKGLNEILVTYTPAKTGDAHVRLFWTARGSYPKLLPQAAFSHTPDEPLLIAQRRQRGRELFLEHRCARCHTPGSGTIPEAFMNAPEFTGIGSRRNAAWLRSLVANPEAARGDARMPAMFHAGDAIDSAEAVAAFLTTLTDPGWSAPPEPADPGEAAAGGQLFGSLHCAACHQPPGATEPAADKLPLDHVAGKFSRGALARYLKEPTEHYGATRMPDFRLSDPEARRIAAFLIANSKPPAGEPPRPELAPKGRDLVQTTGCLNCHTLELENHFTTRPLGEVRLWDGGCLAPQPLAGTRVPHYALSDADRRALREFAEAGFDSLTRHVDAEFAARQVKNLNCAGCHDRQLDSVPPLDMLGGKIKPEYGAKFIAGLIVEKPRPWIAARMPGFATRAEGLARGLANQHGFTAKTPPEPEPVDEELAAIGFKLVGADGGFSCVTCHAVGKSAAPQISESAGVNFAWTFDRIQHDYFVRWLRDPLAVDPTTKMPVFFDESGRSPLGNVLEGDARRQMEAMWQYFRLGPRMKVPPGVGAAAPNAAGR